METERLAGVLYDFLAAQPKEPRDLEPADVIFVFGHNDPRPAEHAAFLFELERARIVLVSGGVGPRTELTSAYSSEADYYGAILQAAHVPKGNVILEDKATNTLENVMYGMSRLTVSMSNPSRIIVVSVAPLLLRSELTLRQHFPQIHIQKSAPNMKREWVEDNAKVKRLCGEIERLIQYSARGDIAHVNIPAGTMEACRVLRSRLGPEA